MTDDFETTETHSPTLDLAPTNWDSYIGQKKVKEILTMKIHAAIARYSQLDHVLLVGASGSGKSSIANLIAGEHGLPFLSLMVTPNFKMNTFNNMLMDFAQDGGGICLADEIHNFTKSQQHYLFTMLEGGYISYDNGKKMYFPHPITFVGATTELQDLIKPLIGRFGAPYHLDEYSEIEMGQIVERMARKVDLSPTKDTCIALGRASAGSPRQAKTLVLAARDIGSMEPKEVLRITGITEDGLTPDHIAYLHSLKKLGSRAGINSIANHCGRPKEIVSDLEKLLVNREYIQISKTGRELMPRGDFALNKALTNH